MKSDDKLKKAAAQKKAEIKKELKAVKEKAKAKIQKVKRERKNKKTEKAQNTVAINRLELLITIVNRNKAEFYADLIQSFDVNMQVVAGAQGTADAKMRELFGFTDNDKAVIFSVVQENKRKDILETLGDKFKSVKGGKGISLSVPFASMIGAAAFGFLSNNKDSVKTDSDDKGGKKGKLS